MKPEKKQMLVKALCEMLPYDVKVLIKAKNCYDDIHTLNIEDLDSFIEEHSRDEKWCDVVTSIKPYLRPMSSMTEEEKNTYDMFFNEDGLLDTSVEIYVDWLCSYYFDYRGLIQMGLALEAPDGMYE